jgi:hypothetical protein
MMQKPVPENLARQIIQEIHSNEGIYTALENLLEVMDGAENEPGTKEIYILCQLNKVMENIKILEGYLQDYVNKEDHGKNKLDELYSRDRRYGTSKLFDY